MLLSDMHYTGTDGINYAQYTQTVHELIWPLIMNVSEIFLEGEEQNYCA